MDCRVYLVAGYTYELKLERIRKIPSLIFNDDALMKQFYDPTRRVFSIARSRAFFEVLVFYINHGIFSRPIDIPLNLFVEEVNYYFVPGKFLSQLKQTHGLPETFDRVEVRYLPRSSIWKSLWRAIEYNETFLGPLYRFVFGSICICSIFIFMHEIIIRRNEYFLEFTEKYRAYIQENIHTVNVTVHFIDYRPDTRRLGFSVEMGCLLFWIVEFVLRTISAPKLELCLKSTFFWIDLVNILNTILYGIFSAKYNQQNEPRADQIKSMTFIFQLIDIVKTLRMIKLGKYHRSITLIIEALAEVSMEVFTLCLVLLGTSCVFGTILYSIERTTNPASTVLFPNVGTSVYYTILGITNVGFEGFLPTTYLGKWIACAAITFGYLSITVPLPLILAPYNRKRLWKKKTYIYRNDRNEKIARDHPDVKHVHRY